MSNKLETEIALNLSGNLSQKARQYGNQMVTLGSKSKQAFGMISSSAQAASRGIDTFGNRAILGTTAVAVAFERTFVKTAAEFERYRTMLNQLQGSEQGGAQALEWIEQFTQNTPFAVNEVTNSFVRLKAFGLDPMDGTMQAIADQAALIGGTAETVDGIALALGQAWTKGKLQGEEALQLLERGVPVWDYLVEASKELGHNDGFGYTAEQLQKMASQGELTRDAITSLITVMGRHSEGAAKNQMDTWNGMISNMGDHWKIFQKDVMESGAFDVLKTELGEFLDRLDEMKETGEYDDFVETVGGNLVEAFRSAAEAAREVKEVGEEIMPVVRLIGDMASSLADTVGGYGNLAKILASVYAINKVARMGSPLVKGAYNLGGFAAGKIKGSKGAANFANMAATPVYVVNMPAGGLGADVAGGSANSKKASKRASSKVAAGASKAASLALPAIVAIEGADIIDNTLASMFDGYRDADRKFTTKLKAFFGDKDAQRMDVEYYGADPAKYERKTAAPSPYLTGNYATEPVNQPYPTNQALNLKIEVADDRINVTQQSSSPGLKVDMDNGPN